MLLRGADMEYVSVKQAADSWGLSERSVRNYCAAGRVPGAVLQGKVWLLPGGAERPVRKKRAGKLATELLSRLRAEKEARISGGIYHKLQIDLTYNSNHIEGSQLTHDQTRYIYETNTVGIEDNVVNVDDIIETVNHFRCIDLVIDQANYILRESFIKQLHYVLKNGTADSRKEWFAVGNFKRYANEVGGRCTVSPEETAGQIRDLLRRYNQARQKSLEDVVSFHYEFEMIHPFQDGNGRVGRLIMLKECLKNGIVPFIISDDLKEYYYRGLANWKKEKGYLLDTCLTAQDRFKKQLDYFGIKY